MKVLVSRPFPGPAVDFLRERGYELTVLDDGRAQGVFKEKLAETDGVIAMLSDSLPATTLASCRNLKAIANYAVGYNNIDLQACTSAGIVVTNTPDVLTDATADIAMLLMLMVMRRAPEAMRFLADGKFTGWKPEFLLGRDLKSKTLGILGMGRIGKAVARRAESFGMKVLYHTRYRAKADLPWPRVSFDGLLSESDVLSLHLPLTDSTCHLIGAVQLGKMKEGAVLVNTSRGPIVDEGALVEALRSEHLFGAGLDVFEEEPKVNPRLWQLPNVVLLPHIGSGTLETRSEMGTTAATSLHEALLGKHASNTVNPEVYSSEVWQSRQT